MDMYTTRQVLKETEFKVVSLKRQETPWHTGGQIGMNLSPGWFVILDPVLPELESDHVGIGLEAVCFRQDGTKVPIKYTTSRRQEDGRMCFFVSDEDYKQITIGDAVKIQESQQPHES